MSNYYISKPDGTQEGPYDKAALFSLINKKIYTPDIYIWCEGMADWKSFREVFTAKKKAPRPASPAPMTAHPIQKKKMKGLMIGIIAGALLATGGVTYWLMSDDEANTELELSKQINSSKQINTSKQINSIEELYKLFEKGFQFRPEGYAYVPDSSSVLSAIRSELTSDSTNFDYVQMGLIVLNHSGATEFFIKNYSLDEKASAFFLFNALKFGAHKVAKVLIDKGRYKLSDYSAESLIEELVSQANIRNASEDCGNIFDIMSEGNLAYNYYGDTRKMVVREEIFIQKCNWQKCAELAIERLGCPVKPKAVKTNINKLKLMGKEKPLTDYISSKM